MIIAFIAGITASLLTIILASGFGLGRDRAFYTTILIVVASYYVLFAATGAATGTLIIEMVIALAFIALALAGHKTTLWIAVAGLALHGVFDLFHGMLVANAGVPGGWPVFCSTYDVLVAAYMGWRLHTGRDGQLVTVR